MNTDTEQQARAHFLAGNAHFEAERLEQALTCFEAALALVERPSILTNLGITQFRLGRWDAALATLDKATLADPANGQAWVARGLSHEALDQWPQAVDCLQRGLSLGASSAATLLSLGRCHWRLGDSAAALKAFDQALALDNTLTEAWSRRGGLLRDAGQYTQAAASFEHAISHGADEALHRFYLASMRGDAAPKRPPAAYVAALFDDYAGDFETHLVQQLQYRAHENLLAPLRAGGRHYPLVLDLGCGTGLCARQIRAQADVVDGVDLSLAMVEQARRSGAYRRVVHGDLVPFLQDQGRAANLVIAADVFIYVGALEAVFQAVRECLQADGCFAFSVEMGSDGEDLRLLPSLRYAHSVAYISRLAQSHGFRLRQQFEAPLRRDQGEMLTGLYVYLEPDA